MKDEEILAVYNQGPDAVIALVKNLLKGFELQIAVHEARIRQLENQINTNSKNSGKPPSSDGFKKTKSQRTKSGKKSGAQKGHPGRTLVMTDNPDKVQVHTVTHCQDCGACLAEQPAESIERRQVIDLPPLKLETTEHRAEQKTCQTCGALNSAAFPDGVNQPAQYGPEIKSLAVYLNQYQFIPYDRTEEFFKDLFGQAFSEGSLFTANQTCYDVLEGYDQDVKQEILDSPVAHFDESGARVEGKLHWLHSVSTEYLTLYGIYQKRGSDAMNEMGILPFYTGIAKHDFWKPYFLYQLCRHSLCNDHHLRELVWVIENMRQTWAGQMHELLLAIRAVVNEAKDNSRLHLELEQLMDFETRYQNIIALGYRENPFFEVWPRPESERGKPKKGKARNLLERLDKHRTEALNFMYNFRVPFGNNQAERDIRMTKVQQKISGGFRSMQGAKIFCRIRGYISTAKKNSVPVLAAIRDAFLGRPFIPGVVAPD
jgi:transposase